MEDTQQINNLLNYYSFTQYNFNNKVYKHFIKCISELSNELKYSYLNNNVIYTNDISYICDEFYNLIDYLKRYCNYPKKPITKN